VILDQASAEYTAARRKIVTTTALYRSEANRGAMVPHIARERSGRASTRYRGMVAEKKHRKINSPPAPIQNVSRDARKRRDLVLPMRRRSGRIDISASAGSISGVSHRIPAVPSWK
jgi:hypothetical protein